MSSDQKYHLDRLDVLRGIAVCSVVLFHCFIGVFGMDRFPWLGLWIDFTAPHDRWFARLYPIAFGWTGVPLFFVISGFCIHWSFLHKGRFSTVAFFRSRFWRIYPAYLAALIVFTALTRTNVATGEGFAQMAAHLFLVHNFSNGTIFGINPSFWSLAVECQFYALFPLFLWMRSKWGVGRSLGVIGALSLLLRSGFALTWDWSLPVPLVWLYHPGVLWFDWILGAYLAERLYAGKPLSPVPFPVAAGGLAIAFFCSVSFKPLSLFSFTFASLLSVVMVDKVLRWERPLYSFERVVAPVGLISYSIYLWHQPILVRVLRLLSLIDLPGGKITLLLVALPVAAVLIGGVSVLSYRVFEHFGVRFNERSKRRPVVEMAVTR